MKFLFATALFTAMALAGCSTTGGENGVNGNRANLSGTNSNTGYVSNSETNAKPTVPADATNIEPPNVNSLTDDKDSKTHSNKNSDKKTP